MKRFAQTLLVLPLLAACSSQPTTQDNPAAAAPTATAPTAAMAPIPDVFGQCAVCHTSSQGAPDGVGPNLFGVYGRKAGTHPGYAYSDALKASGITWNDATLDQWLTKPQAFVDGTKMTFTGLSNPDQRKQAIAYLKTLK